MELCQNCHTGHLIEPPNGQQSYLKCDACNAILLLYKPMPHQVEYHKDQTKFKGFLVGTGQVKPFLPVKMSFTTFLQPRMGSP